MGDQLDRIIDSALAEYSNVEPRAELEQRVLAHLRQRKARRAWAFAGALAVAAMIVLTLAVQPHPSEAPPVERPQPPVAVAKQMPAPVAAARPHARRQPSVPKRRQFPTFSPLTEQERVLLRAVRLNPEEARNAFASMQERNNAPVEIGAIEIEPLPGNP
jgi:hypothetical protein